MSLQNFKYQLSKPGLFPKAYCIIIIENERLCWELYFAKFSKSAQLHPVVIEDGWKDEDVGNKVA